MLFSLNIARREEEHTVHWASVFLGLDEQNARRKAQEIINALALHRPCVDWKFSFETKQETGTSETLEINPCVPS